MPSTPTLECVWHGPQGLATCPATDNTHSSPLPSHSHSSHFTAAERSPVAVQASNSSSPYDTVAIAQSSSVIYQTEALDVSAAVGNLGIGNVNGSSHAAVANTYLEVNDDLNSLDDDDSDSSDVSVAVTENSPPATERVGIFRFSDLVPEIRNRIYHIVLRPPQDPSICLTQILDDRPLRAPSGGIDFDNTFRTKSVVPNRKHKDPDWGIIHQVSPQDLSILLVSKQIYVEAFHVFYATNCFSFTDTGLLYRFLKTIGYIRRQHLTMIYFLWRGPDAKEAFRLLKTCRRLKIVQFTVPCSHPPGYEALKDVRVETAKARALVHFAPAQYPPLSIYNHTSCFGDYLCHCMCRRHYEPASNLREIENAMMRPRRGQDIPAAEEKYDLFKPKRERFKKSEEQDILDQKASFDEFIGRIEQQGKRLTYLGHRNKAMEAALNQTLTGTTEVDYYFREFAAKLARDKRQIKRVERWEAKQLEKKEDKERHERWKREAVEEKERGIKTRKEARELKWKMAREKREDARKMAREARELRRRTAREAKERERLLAGEARVLRKAAREADRLRKKTNKGAKKLEKKMVSASS